MVSPEHIPGDGSHIGRYLGHGIGALRQEDPDLYRLLELEHDRQRQTLSLVASCGITDPSVLAVTGASIVNVTAEGYPGNRYHAGCRYVDEVERLAIERTKQVFGAKYVNVQPHCASFANHTVMQAVLDPGDTIVGMALDQGGHLTHGSPVNLSGKLFTVHAYGLDEHGVIDYTHMAELARTHRPKLIVCGTTSYPRTIDFDRIRAIADSVGAYVLADVTHIAGLIAAGLHASPIDAAHFTTTCTFKQLYGPRGGLIMMGRDAEALAADGKRTLSQRIQSAVFPMMQGSPEVHTIAAKARAMGRLLDPAFRELAERIQANASALARALTAHGYDVIGGGTDNHIVLFRAPEKLNGLIAERALEACDILVNKNKIPGDTRSATVASGVRLGSNTVALRGLGPSEMDTCAELLHAVLDAVEPGDGGAFHLDDAVRTQVSAEVRRLCRDFPLPYDPAPSADLVGAGTEH
ncbi:serine hydroxymethyltransferase [Kibdelosporangium philippinense]|uniref:Probable serine hydroxymethyltransferase n=1 Tax=Kibdelosporangium philippinense TaxID=211113 RepID=A0ABS8Z3A2_9PSEU|nr:serine hydroxymethyltransferase [Kibdelosporangium philippinense]MCE7001952.1 serine hydroxymethyltransferase [Kibdelosporangium philippinense]